MGSLLLRFGLQAAPHLPSLSHLSFPPPSEVDFPSLLMTVVLRLLCVTYVVADLPQVLPFTWRATALFLHYSCERCISACGPSFCLI